jgi:hypothetical protein
VGYIVLNNLSLQLNTVGFYQVRKGNCEAGTPRGLFLPSLDADVNLHLGCQQTFLVTVAMVIAADLEDCHHAHACGHGIRHVWQAAQSLRHGISPHCVHRHRR